MTMTNDDEEKFLLDKLLSQRERVEIVRKRKVEAEMEYRRECKLLDDIGEAVRDYMLGNGILETDNFQVFTSTSVDVESIDAVPETFIRTKISKEVDKAKIRSMKPEGNWYVMKETKHVKLRGDK